MVLGFSKLLGGFMAVLEKIASWVGALFSIIPKTLYLLITFAMQIVDIIQLLFQKLAGLDVYYVTENGTATKESGDFLIYFLRKVLFEKGTLNTVFWSIVILGLFLLVFATIVAVIRTQYNYDEKPVSPTKVVGQAIKSLLSFAIVPIVAFFGVYLGNIFLQAINSATTVQTETISFDSSARIKLEPYTLSNGKKTYAGIDLFGKNFGINNETFSGMVFRAATYRANRIRNNADFRALCDGTNETTKDGKYSGVTFGLFQVTANDYETAAKRLDDAFVFNYRLDQNAYVNTDANSEMSASLGVGILFGDFTIPMYLASYNTFSRYNVAWVWYYYDLWQFDYVMAIIAIVALAVIYLNITSAMMKRAIELTMLMIVSPAVVAVTPLDGGGMQKRWRENFIKKTLSAYGAVVGTNLLFIILPIIRDINFFNIPIVDTIVQLLFTIVGLLCIKDFMKMMSELAGGEDANAVGGEVNKKLADTAMKVGSVVAPAAGAGMKMLGKVGKGVVKGIANNSKSSARARMNNKALKRAEKEEMEDLMGAGLSKAEAKDRIENDTSVQHRVQNRANYHYADMSKRKEQKRYKRPTMDLEKREKNKYIRGLMEDDKKNLGATRSTDYYEAEAETYLKSDAGKKAVAQRRSNRENLKDAGAFFASPLRMMGVMAGQVVDGAYGDKSYDSYKNMKNSYEGKATSAFGGAAAKEAKERSDKESAKQQQQQENDRQSAMLSAQEKTNELLNQVIRRL